MSVRDSCYSLQSWPHAIEPGSFHRLFYGLYIGKCDLSFVPSLCLSSILKEFDIDAVSVIIGVFHHHRDSLSPTDDLEPSLAFGR